MIFLSQQENTDLKPLILFFKTCRKVYRGKPGKKNSMIFLLVGFIFLRKNFLEFF